MEFGRVVTFGCLFLSYFYNVNCFLLDANTEITKLKIEAEEMEIQNGEVHSRSRASNLEAVHLYKDSALTYDFCIMSTTMVLIEELSYSNDGPTDRVSIQIDNEHIGYLDTKPISANGGGWDMFQVSSLNLGRVLTEGRHKLQIIVTQSDSYGVEIDFVKMTVNAKQNLPSLQCMAFCFDDITYEDNLPFSSDTHNIGFARQRSTRTLCAEEDNINVPVFHPNVTSFVVAATKPKYTSFKNNRGADWAHCQMNQAFWRFTDIHVNTMASRNASMAEMRVSRLTNKTVIDVTFSLQGASTGSTDAYIGTDVFLGKLQTNKITSNMTVIFQYLSKSGQWSTPQVKAITAQSHEINFTTPDFALKEGDSNKLLIQIVASASDLDNLIIGDLYMFKRHIKEDVSETIYKDSTTVIEGVRVDMWWRINETMTVSLTDSADVFTGYAYIRVYERVPWQETSYSQIFVMYQDGNVRLLQITPHGLDWIPFGSSVIIGQTDPSEPRPSAPIKHVQVDPTKMSMTITYSDKSWIVMNIRPAWQETVLVVSSCHFVRSTIDYPFFTFRSMWVEDGNGDVDHVSIDTGRKYSTWPIIGNWSLLKSNFFAFYRKCISKHNTLSPDIVLKITGDRNYAVY